jgi:plastocyanin
MRPVRVLPLLLCLAPLGSLGCKASSMTESSLPSHDVSIVPNASTRANLAFSPNPFGESFASRATVIWLNLDKVAAGGGYGGTAKTTHHLVSDTGLFDSGLLEVGHTFTFTFAASGSYSYHCSIHPTMVGTITITP